MNLTALAYDCVIVTAFHTRGCGAGARPYVTLDYWIQTPPLTPDGVKQVTYITICTLLSISISLSLSLSLSIHRYMCTYSILLVGIIPSGSETWMTSWTRWSLSCPHSLDPTLNSTSTCKRHTHELWDANNQIKSCSNAPTLSSHFDHRSGTVSSLHVRKPFSKKSWVLFV